MAKILIIGAGSMGAAFSIPCLDSQHQVKIVGTHLENKFIDDLKNNHNFHLPLNYQLSNETNIVKYNNLADELINKPDLIVLAISSKGINWTVDQFSYLSNEIQLPPILILTKGLSIFENNFELLDDKLKRLLTNKGFKNLNISSVGGPCLASGLANKVHTSVVFTNINVETVKWLQKILSTEYYHISISDDRIGVQVCSAIKNIFSMVIGSSKGQCNNKINNDLKKNNYLNTAASLMKQSLYEMSLFVNYLNGNKETAFGLAGLGDLYVSATGGRNSKMGFFIGEGYLYSEAKKLKMPKETIEGAELVFEIGEKIREDFNFKKIPLMFAMIDSILDDKKLNIRWDNFQ